MGTASKQPGKPKTVELELEEPYPFGTDTIERLTIRRPKGRDYKKMPAGLEDNPGLLLDWAAHLSGHPPSVFDDMDCVDVNRVLEVVGGFFDTGQPTGE